MATQTIGLSAQVTTTALTQTITASSTGVGAPLSYTSPTSGVMLVNVGPGGAQYRIDNAAWVVLDKNEGNYIPADLSINRVGVRLINDGALSTKLEYVAESMPTAYIGRSGETFPVANPPVTVTGYRYSGVVATAVPGTGYTFTAGQWYRDGVAIGGQTALTYTRTDTDIGTALTFIPTGMTYAGAGGSTLAAIVDPTVIYARFRSSLAAVSAGTGYSRIGLHGDSTVGGARALGPAANAVRTECPAVYLKTRLNLVQSLPTIATSWIGDQSFGQTNTLTNYAYDARLSQPDGAGFAHSGLTRTVAGSMMQNNANTFRMGFLAEDAVDTFDIYYAVNTTLGSFNITRTGSTLVPVNQAGTSGTGKVTLVGTLSGSNPLYVARNAGGAYIIGTDAYNSAIKSIRIFGLGWSGGKVADWIVSTQGFDPLPALLALNLDLVLIRPGINDAVSGTVPATFKTQLATLVDALIAAGTNVALATHYPSNIASAAQATQDAIAQQVRDVATERGLSLRDTYAQWGTWVAANALGYMSDNLHPNKAGYEAEAASTATFLLALAA